MHRRHLEIAQPCAADWEQMPGTNAARHCSSCSKNVYNLSILTEREARAALAVRPPNACVRYHFDLDGRVVFFPEAQTKRWPAASGRTLAAVLAVSAMSACAQPEPHALPAAPVAIAPAADVTSKSEAARAAQALQKAQAEPTAVKAEDLERSDGGSCDPRWKEAFVKRRSIEHLRDMHVVNGGMRTPSPSRPQLPQQDDELVYGASAEEPEAGASGSQMQSRPTRDQILEAFGKVRADAAKCASAGVATADVRIAGSSGKVTSVKVTGVERSAAVCVEKVVRRVRLPLFRERSFELKYPFKLRG